MTTTPAAPSRPKVPLLDIKRQNAPLEAEIDQAIAEVCRSGAFVQGPACREFEEAVADYCGTLHAVGCASGSDALLLALMAVGVGPGDEVIVPSFTFFATAGSVWRLGAKPVFADIEPETFNIDPDDVARKLTPATKAIMPVHLFGQCADMERLKEVAGDLPILEDAAQSIGAEFQGRRAGSLGTMGCFSFYPTKNLGGFGDGGMITTDDDQLAAQLRVLRNHGQHPQYYHSTVGLNSRLDAIQAAVLSVKLRRLDDYAAGRQRHAEGYAEAFKGLGDSVIAPAVADGCVSVWNQYTVRATRGTRDALKTHLDSCGVGAAIYYPVPLHLQDCFSGLGYETGSLPETERAADEVLSLPIFGELTADEHSRVVAAVKEFAVRDAGTPEPDGLGLDELAA
ncbi:MAG: DegT/DnrJ/EryC1/StrS family aminotransferase [Planctomycetota bacterium]